MPYFKYVGKKELPIRAYNADFQKGKATKLEGHFAEKAANNPDFALAGGRPRKQQDDS